MRKKLTHNLGLKIASLFLACIIWFMVAQIGDPKDTKVYSNIPVTLINTDLLDAENKVYSILNDSDVVSVEVCAPKSTLSNIRISDIVAEADMAKLTDINTIAIKFSIPNAEVDSIYGSHDVVQLAVEEKKTKWIRVEHDTIGEVAEGYIVYGETLDQTLIEVSGPISVINDVSYAKAELDVTGATSNMSANVVVEFYDRDNQLLDDKNIKKNADLIHMYVEILATKDVGIKLHTSGKPADGYALTGEVSATVSKVTIAGTKYQLNTIDAIDIPAEVMDATGVKQSFSNTIDIKDYLPEGIRIADSKSNTSITVFAEVEPIVQMDVTLLPDDISLVGSIDGKEILKDDTEESYIFTAKGLQRDLDSFASSQIQAIANLDDYLKEIGKADLKPGTYEIPIEISTPDIITITNEPKLKIVVK